MRMLAISLNFISGGSVKSNFKPRWKGVFYRLVTMGSPKTADPPIVVKSLI